MTPAENPAAAAPEIGPLVSGYTATDYLGRAYGAHVGTLNLPKGARRVWRNESDGGIVVRDLGGLGPKGHVPVGFVAPGIVLTDYPSAMRELDIYFVSYYYATAPEDRKPYHGNMWPAFGQATCRWCQRPRNLPHAADCCHVGKNVGDPVR